MYKCFLCSSCLTHLISLSWILPFPHLDKAWSGKFVLSLGIDPGTIKIGGVSFLGFSC